MMNMPLTYAPSFGTQARDILLDSVSKALNAGPERVETLVFFSSAAVLVLLLLLLARWSGRRAGGQDGRQPDYLALAVDWLGLDERDRRDLRRIAKRAGVRQPVSMLLSPMNLAHAAAATLEAEKDREFRARIGRLCVRLFDTPLPDVREVPR
jgi:hypothetical protein